MHAGSLYPLFGRRQSESEHTNAYLFYALTLVNALQKWIDLPLTIPPALIRQFEHQLDEPTHKASEQAAHKALAALQHTIDGYTPRYSPNADGLPEEHTLPLIEQALSENKHLTITYYSTSRNSRTHRTITPYRLEWRGPIAYLIAYCQHAHEERRFRVSRIEAIALGDEMEDEEEWIDEWWQK